MREFNKVFVIALPRCATVSMYEALGILGVPIAHLGKIYGEKSSEHNNPRRLMRMHEQIAAGDVDLDILKECRGLADYPACSSDVFKALDRQFPNSLFINVRRDQQKSQWLQSVESQFIGLELLKLGKQATPEEQAFMRTMQSFRAMTFGQSRFEAAVFADAYDKYQADVADYFKHRAEFFLDIPDVDRLQANGFGWLSKFLDCSMPDAPFPCSNGHSLRPQQAFMAALNEGRIESQTGIKPNIHPVTTKSLRQAPQRPANTFD